MDDAISSWVGLMFDQIRLDRKNRIGAFAWALEPVFKYL